MASDILYPNGNLKAKFIRHLRPGECCCNWDNKPEYFTDGTKIYMKAAYMKIA